MAPEESTRLAVPMLAGRYVHVRELGKGGSGRVLLVEDRLEGGPRAVKIVSREDGERLGWERALLGSLAHPSLARVYELLTVGERLGPPWSLDAGAVVLVEEHVDGLVAAEAAAALENDEARVRFAVTVGASVARALGAIHGRGLVHCDVKPANVVVPDDPARARLIDLGLCRPAGSSDTVSGTLGYLAPEALLGQRTPATDLFALGATLHALLLGRTAFDTEASKPTLADALARRPRVDELPSAVPLALRRLLGDLLAESPDERPDAAREVALRLAAIGDELGFEVGSDASLSAGPLPVERAARASVMALAGRSEELASLVAQLEQGGVVAVRGPGGAGRSRLVREAVHVVQAELSRERRAPTYVTSSRESPPRLDHDAVVHLEGPRVDWDACRFAVDAADVQGVLLGVVVEVPDAAHVPEGVPCVELRPIADAVLSTLLAELLEVDPSEALVEAARAASAGLPGRLCRLVAEGFAAGLEPSRPATLADLGRRHPDAAVIPEAARPLAEALVVSGGALGSAEAGLLFDDAAEMALALIAAGLASVDGSGRVALREDVRVPVSAAAAKVIARHLEPLDLDPLTRGHVLAALGEDRVADAAFCTAITAARGAGEPERAAAIGLGALDRLAAPSLELRIGTADALRARAREAAALDVLEGRGESEAVSTRAELARLLGDEERATSEASAAADARGRVVLGCVALSRGDLDAAVAAVDGLEADDALLARAHEIRAFAALMRGRPDDATQHSREAMVAAQRTGCRAQIARALSVEGSVLQARGLVQEAAARFERAFELADAAGERYAAASYLVNVALGRLERGAAGPAIDALREGARRLTELGRRRDAARALYNLGNAGALVGDDDLARGAVRRARQWADEGGDTVASALAAVVEADIAVRAGKLDLASRVLEEAWTDVPEAIRVTLGARRAIVAAVRGETQRAAASLDAIDGLSADHVGVVERAVARARVALALDDGGEAARHAAQALQAAEGAGWECRLRAALCASDAFDRAGRSEEAAAALARARALLDYAASTLSPHARARLRAVPAYQRAFAAAPTAPPHTDSDARWKALARHAKRLVREPRLDRLHEAIVDAAVELVDAERGFLVQRLPDGTVRVLAARAFGADLEQERPSTSVVARALDGGRTLVTVDALEDARWDGAASVVTMALRSVLGVPLPLAGRAMALVLDDRLRPGAFDEAAVRIVEDLAELAAGAIERAEALRAERREARRLAREKRRLSARVESAEQELSELRRRGGVGPAFAGIIATSDVMRKALRLAERVAASDVPVLVRGESGTGKELVARAVHDASARREGPYVSENCSAIPESLLESTLFGHVRGAFTGADRARRGLFEIADGGTLFLDEIGEMSEAMQAKLLRVLQDGELRPVGSERTRKVDVRLVFATHRDLMALVESKKFRQDLYYRIAVVEVELPPLRERPDDVPALVAAFLERHAADRPARVDARAMSALRAYRWPGNVRELENEIRRALVLTDDVISLEHLSPVVHGGGDGEPLDELDLKGRVAALERRLIRRALDETEGNQTRAAEVLGVSRYGLQKMMKRLGVTRR